MTELRFDGRVAIVTGAGAGLGLAYAELLASRGARVVVNDVGSDPDGNGGSTARAEAAAAAIVAAGGEAVPDANTVASVEGARAIVQTALDACGHVDIVINNAGFGGGGYVPQVVPQPLGRLLDVHLLGPFFLVAAVWDGMRERGYGRILNTTSAAGLFGLRAASAYGAAKLGTVGFTRCLAHDGRPCGIGVNAIAPAAWTRLSEGLTATDIKEWFADRFQPSQVAAAAAFLVHEECSVSGEVFSAGGGRVARVFMAETRGFSADELTPESVRDNFPEVQREDGYVVPTSTNSEMHTYLEALNGKRIQRVGGVDGQSVRP